MSREHTFRLQTSWMKTAQFTLRMLLIISLGAAMTPAWSGETGRRDATRGSLWLHDSEGRATGQAPLLHTDVDMDITGMLARVKVNQRFTNPADDWAEGVYVFPLPEHAAVDHLRMRIGERVIEGLIKERSEAKKTYEQAKQQGQRASLVEQERPNIFTTSVANIAPGETISVEIEYQQTVHYSDGAFSIRFPMVVGPRYIPGRAIGVDEELVQFSGTGWAQATDEVEDAARITPPVQHPGRGAINPVSLAIRLAAGMPLAQISSSYHRIHQQTGEDHSYRIELAEGTTPADRDFELVWRPPPGKAPGAAWFSQTTADGQYGLLMLVPPQSPDGQLIARREVVFVIDTSGSMHGDSIEQARNALLLALDRLTPGDRFNIIEFNSTTRRLFDISRPADPHHLAVASNHVRGLRANGGTEMLPALQQALRQDSEQTGVRQVIFLTDGSVGNEKRLFQVIRRELGDSRLFTIGIGSAPNSHFMRKAAEFGRGTFTYIGKVTEVMEKMSALFQKLERPALTDIRIDLPEDMQMLPRRIPDLYLGEPLLLSFHAEQLPPALNLRGRFGDRTWQTRVALNGGQSGSTLAPEWGRRRIAELMTQLHDADRETARQSLRNQLVQTALSHHLVSKYTSLVAVDVTPARKREELLQQHAMKTNLPTGWSYEHVFGAQQTATPAQLQLAAGFTLLLLAGLSHLRLRRQAC